MTEKMTLLQIMQKVQAETPPITKKTAGRTGNQTYKYSPIEQIQKVLHPILAKYGAGYIQSIDPAFPDFLCTTVYTADESANYYHEKTESSNDPKQLGSAITYAKRYALVATF